MSQTQPANLITMDQAIRRFAIDAPMVNMFIAHLRRVHELSSVAKNADRTRLYDPDDVYTAAFGCFRSDHGFVRSILRDAPKPAPPKQAGESRTDGSAPPGAPPPDPSPGDDPPDSGEGGAPPDSASALTTDPTADMRSRKAVKVATAAEARGLVTSADAATTLGLTYGALQYRASTRGLKPAHTESGTALWNLDELRRGLEQPVLRPTAALSEPAPLPHSPSPVAGEPPEGDSPAEGPAREELTAIEAPGSTPVTMEGTEEELDPDGMDDEGGSGQVVPAEAGLRGLSDGAPDVTETAVDLALLLSQSPTFRSLPRGMSRQIVLETTETITSS